MNSLAVHHIAPFIVKKQLSGHSYAVPALCESISGDIDTHLHTAGSSNLVFDPSFSVHEYKIDPMLRFILSSQDFKIGLKKITHDCDIIHSHGVWRMPQLYARLVKKIKNIKIVNSPKGSFSKDALNVSKYKKFLFSLFSSGLAINLEVSLGEAPSKKTDTVIKGSCTFGDAAIGIYCLA